MEKDHKGHPQQSQKRTNSDQNVREKGETTAGHKARHYCPSKHTCVRNAVTLVWGSRQKLQKVARGTTLHGQNNYLGKISIHDDIDVHHNQAHNTHNGGDSCLLMGCLSVLEELSHELVDQVRSILLYPVTAVRDVPVGREEGWGEERDRGRGWRDGNHIPLHHNDITGFLLHSKVGDDRAMSISQAPLCKGIIISL